MKNKKRIINIFLVLFLLMMAVMTVMTGCSSGRETGQQKYE